MAKTHLITRKSRLITMPSRLVTRECRLTTRESQPCSMAQMCCVILSVSAIHTYCVYLQFSVQCVVLCMLTALRGLRASTKSGGWCQRGGCWTGFCSIPEAQPQRLTEHMHAGQLYTSCICAACSVCRVCACMVYRRYTCAACSIHTPLHAMTRSSQSAVTACRLRDKVQTTHSDSNLNQ